MVAGGVGEEGRIPVGGVLVAGGVVVEGVGPIGGVLVAGGVGEEGRIPVGGVVAAGHREIAGSAGEVVGERGGCHGEEDIVVAVGTSRGYVHASRYIELLDGGGGADTDIAGAQDSHFLRIPGCGACMEIDVAVSTRLISELGTDSSGDSAPLIDEILAEIVVGSVIRVLQTDSIACSASV